MWIQPCLSNLNHCSITSDIQEMLPPEAPQQQPVHNKSMEKNFLVQQ